MTKRTSSKPQPSTEFSRPGGLVNLTLLTLLAAIAPLGSALALKMGVVTPPGALPDAVYILTWLSVGVAALVCAWAFWTLKPWAWNAAFVVMVVSLLPAVYAIFRGTDTTLGVITLVPAVLVLYMINTPGARRFFRR